MITHPYILSTLSNFSRLVPIRYASLRLNAHLPDLVWVKGFENLISRISRLCALNPFAISVTWGAGGSTKERSLELVDLTQTDYGVDTLMHLTCTNMEQGMVHDALQVRV